MCDPSLDTRKTPEPVDEPEKVMAATPPGREHSKGVGSRIRWGSSQYPEPESTVGAPRWLGRGKELMLYLLLVLLPPSEFDPSGTLTCSIVGCSGTLSG
jgi:hypothetical protein